MEGVVRRSRIRSIILRVTRSRNHLQKADYDGRVVVVASPHEPPDRLVRRVLQFLIPEDVLGLFERPVIHALAHRRRDGFARDESRPYILALGIEEFASPVAALTADEEMLLVHLHPLEHGCVTPWNGQPAYVGHICKFRQKVSRLLSSLPAMPGDGTVVQVRTGKSASY